VELVVELLLEWPVDIARRFSTHTQCRRQDCRIHL